mgnify:CR=1 FL=1
MIEYRYEKEQDILDIELDRNSHHSIPVGGIVIDVNNEGELAGLEIFNASENISRYADVSPEEAEQLLDNIESLQVESAVKQGMMSITIDFRSVKGSRVTRMPINVEAPA